MWEEFREMGVIIIRTHVTYIWNFQRTKRIYTEKDFVLCVKKADKKLF